MIKQAFIGVNDKNSDTIGGENFDGRKRLSGWLNKEMKIEMTDGRIIIGDFVCTDRSLLSVVRFCSKKPSKFVKNFYSNWSLYFEIRRKIINFLAN